MMAFEMHQLWIAKLIKMFDKSPGEPLGYSLLQNSSPLEIESMRFGELILLNYFDDTLFNFSLKMLEAAREIIVITNSR
jgi:hypothetical protein